MKKFIVVLAILNSMSAFAIDGEYLGVTNKGTYVYKISGEVNHCVNEYDSLEQAKMKASYCTGLKNLPQQQLSEEGDSEAERMRNAVKVGDVLERLGVSSVKNHIWDHSLSWDIYTVEEKNRDINCLNIVNRREPKNVSTFAALVLVSALNPIDTYKVFNNESSSGVRYSKVKELCWNVNF